MTVAEDASCEAGSPPLGGAALLAEEEAAEKEPDERSLARVGKEGLPDAQDVSSEEGASPLESADVLTEEEAEEEDEEEEEGTSVACAGEEGLHGTEEPPLIRVQASPSAGRFYVAASEIHGGELLLQASTEAAVVHESLLSRVCAGCFVASARAPYTHCCQRCQYAYYCSSACQSASASRHALECEALGRLRSQRSKLDRVATTRARLVLQVLCSRLNWSARGERDPTKELCTGLEAFEAQKSWGERHKRYRAIYHAVNGALGEGFPLLEAEVEELLGAIECNSFGIWDYCSDRLLGMSVCVSASLFNHSCRPNVVRVTRGQRLAFYALAPAKEGEPLCISYLDPRSERGQRRRELLDSYGFSCQCPRCAGKAKVPLPAMCSSKHLGYMVPGAPGGEGPWCSVCGISDRV